MLPPLATVSAARSNALIAQHRPTAIALTDGYHLAFWIACGLVVTAAAIAATVPRPQPARQRRPRQPDSSEIARERSATPSAIAGSDNPA